MKVIAYQTHYEIEDYDIGDCYELEKQFKTFDEVKFFILYKRKAILCKATEVLPEPAIP